MSSMRLDFGQYFSRYFDPGFGLPAGGGGTQARAPVCQEERQYALFLYNRLLTLPFWEASGEALSACGIPEGARVVRVFFEAAFLRDMFCRDRQERVGFPKTFEDARKNLVSHPNCFNRRLFDYLDALRRDAAMENEYNRAMRAYLRAKRQGPERGPETIPADRSAGGRGVRVSPGLTQAMRWMMKTTPDLAILYTLGGKERYLRLIECKYLSNEDVYTRRGELPRIAQRDAQNAAGDFLCRQIDGLVFKGSGLVRFLSDINRSWPLKDASPLELSRVIPREWMI